MDKETKRRTVVFEIFGAVIWVIASILVSQLLVGTMLSMTVDSEDLGQPIWTAVFAVLYYPVALSLIIWGPLWLKTVRESNKMDSPDLEELGLRGWPTWTDVGLAPAGFIIYLFLAAGATALFSLFPWFNAEQAQDVGFNFLASRLDRVVAFLTLVVVAPIAEEIIFRGWLYGKLRQKISGRIPDWVGAIIAILLTSLAFGLMHLKWGEAVTDMQWNVAVNVFMMSIVLCGLREITGTIHAGILLHILKNGVAFYLLYFAGIG